MRKLLQAVGVITILGVGATLLMAAASGRGAVKFRSVEYTLNGTSTVRLNDPAVLKAAGITHYNQVCWKRSDFKALEDTFIAHADVNEDDSQGWSFVGGEKECQDWDQNIKIFGWTDGSGLDKKIKLLFVE